MPAETIRLARLNGLLAAQEELAMVAAAAPVAVASPTTVAATTIAVAPTLPASAPGEAQLVIAAGRPVPVLVRTDPNPASAGTYPAEKRFSVGDEVVYAEFDGFGARLLDRVLRVTRVDEDADHVELNDGRYLWDTMGNFIRNVRGTYTPFFQQTAVDYQVGRVWKTRFRFSTAANDSYYDFRIVAREKVRTFAGEFDAFRIEGAGFNENGTQLAMTMWQAPRFNFLLKVEFTMRERSSPIRGGELYELISCRQMRWSAA